MALEIGDVILTGTPSDLGEAHPPVFLAPGDVIRVSVEGIGALENPVTIHVVAVRRRHQDARVRPFAVHI